MNIPEGNERIHPAYYTMNRKHEPKDIIADFGLNFNLGNAVKYIARAGKKPGNSVEDDISKAIDYLDFEIENVKNDWGDEYRYANKLDIKVNQDFVNYILIDWYVTDEYLRKALKRIFKVSSTRFNQEVYLDLNTAKTCLESYLDELKKEPMQEIKAKESPTTPAYDRGWNDAMDDVIDYVKKSPYYPNADDLIGHCKASKK